MTFCGKCGTQMEDGAKFCPACGAPAAQPDVQPETDYQPAAPAAPSAVEQGFEKFNDTPDMTNDFDPSDVERNKIMGVLAYCSWLVLIPIFAAKDSRFARFHVNQGLVLAVAELIVGVVFNIVKGILHYGFLWTIVNLASSLLGLGFLVLSILGIVNALNGRAKELPLVGSIRILK